MKKELALAKPEVTAKLLDTTTGVLAVWRTTGKVDLPYIKIGKSVRYRLSDIEAFINANTRTHTA